MNFSKSLLTVAMLVSVSAASAFPGESLFSKEAISFRFGQAKEKAAAVWAQVPTTEALKVGAQYRLTQASEAVAPYMTKKAAAVTAAAGLVTGASVVAYKKGYFGKAAQAVVNFGSAVKAKFTSKK